MRLKNDLVLTRGASPEIVIALLVAASVYERHGQELVVTSMNDSRHSATSLHYRGDAVDLRTNFWPDTKAREVARELDEALSLDYDVIFEGDHIHVEYQPKRLV